MVLLHRRWIKMFSTNSVLAGIAAIVIAYLYIKWNIRSEKKLNDIEKTIIEYWDIQIKQPLRKFERIAVGINSNLDVIVQGVKLLKELGISPGQAKDRPVLESLSDLQEAFNFYFRKGSAAERTFSGPEPFVAINTATDALVNKVLHIGGNAALIASITSALFPEVKIQFVGPVGPTLVKMMPEAISIPPSSLIAKDEVHLIMEYSVSEMWGSASAPVANRFICSYDYSNARITMLQTFFDTLDDFKSDLVVLSGLHLLDSQEAVFYKPKIKELASGLQKIPNSLPIHLELASMAKTDFVNDLVTLVFRHVDSLGLNEQELMFASKSAGGPHGKDSDHHLEQPEIHKISDILLWLMTTFGRSAKNPDFRLSRIHFHSLTYHIGATTGGRWVNTESAIPAGARVAATQASNTSHLDPDIVDIKIPLKFKLFSGDVEREFNPSRPIISYSRDGVNFVLSPVLVCKRPLKTVGLGDAISATGLMYSQFIYDAN